MPQMKLLLVNAVGLLLLQQPKSVPSKQYSHPKVNVSMQSGQVVSIIIPNGWFSDYRDNMISIMTPKPGPEWAHGLFPRNGAFVRILESGIRANLRLSSPHLRSLRPQIQSKLLPTKDYRVISIDSKTFLIQGSPTLVDVFEIEYNQTSYDAKQMVICYVWVSGDRVMFLKVGFLRPSEIEKTLIATAESLLASIDIH